MMIDRKKLIKGLECCIRMNSRLDERDCDDCPYNYQSDGTCASLSPLLEDALALLKEQETLIREYAEKTEDIARRMMMYGASLLRATDAPICESQSSWTSMEDESNG